jgi:glycosyltransferase involved in cell wall biosynthesis
MARQIVQILSTFFEAHPVTQVALALQKEFEKQGWASEIYAADSFDDFSKKTLPLQKLDLSSSAVHLVHSYGLDESNPYGILSGTAQKILLRHFSPSAESLAPFSLELSHRAQRSESFLRQAKSSFQQVWADSAASQKELEAFGYTDIRIEPTWSLGFDPSHFSQQAPKPGKMFEKTGPLWLVHSSIFPHERIEDVIRLFCWYKQYCQPEGQLLILGGPSFPEYELALHDVAHSLKIQRDVFFIHEMSPAELETCYPSVDLLISLSEEEPFRKEWYQAALRKVPLLLFENSGSRELLGERGLFIKGRDFPVIAEFIHQILTDSSLKAKIVQGQARVQKPNQTSLNRMITGITPNLTAPSFGA